MERAEFNVFISWSGERSKLVASALHNWIPLVIQTAKPFMSDTDIEKGSRGLADIASALNGVSLGITCLTPENLSAIWLFYEAGAISKAVDGTKTKLCTLLLGGLRPEDVKGPLGMFQATKRKRRTCESLSIQSTGRLETRPWLRTALIGSLTVCGRNLTINSKSFRLTQASPSRNDHSKT